MDFNWAHYSGVPGDAAPSRLHHPHAGGGVPQDMVPAAAPSAEAHAAESGAAAVAEEGGGQQRSSGSGQAPQLNILSRPRRQARGGW